MTEMQRALIWGLIAVSVLIIAVPIIILVLRKIVFAVRGYKSQKNSQLARSLLAFSAMILGAVWCVRLASEIFCFIIDSQEITGIDWCETVLKTFLSTLQTFSLDENYESCVLIGKLMMRALAGEGSSLVGLYGVYLSVLNVLAPVAGGAIIFDILSSIFPMMRLFFANIAFWNTKYYFSELNESALALACSICETEKTFFKKPVVIFTEAHSGKDSDNGADLIYKAKLLGAICVPDDIINISKNRFGARKYILIADDETKNLQSFTGLASERSYKCLKNSEVYLFSRDDMYMPVEEQVRVFLRDKLSDKEFPIIVPVQSDRNLATNLIDDLPLYEPVIDKKKDKNGIRDLTVTIFGAGKVGMEMFMASYWSGQMLDVCLNINVVSLESKEKFYGSLDYINPEIRKSAMAGSEILRCNGKGDYSEPYCSINYFSADVSAKHMSDILSSKTESGDTLYKTDYFIVCLGADETNIAVANKLSQTMGARHLSDSEDAKTVIAYVVRDSELCEMLNVKNNHDFSLADGADLYMYAFGSLNEVYSTRNIFMRDFELKAVYGRGASVDSEKYKKELSKIHKSRAKDDYSYWSHLARSRHVKYKIFSGGLLTKSIFDRKASGEVYNEKEIEKEKNDRFLEMVNATEKYKSLIYGSDCDLKLIHRLAWLEHRRWCAFLRVRGFCSTDKYTEYYERMNSHKNMPLKLHPCLVETDKNGMKAEFDSTGRVIKQLLFEKDVGDEADELDKVSINVRKLKPDQKDFKIYDYPVEDFRELKK